MSGNTTIIVILVMNTLVSIGIFIYAILRGIIARKTLILLSLLILISPIVGLIFLSVGQFLSLIYREKDIDMEDISFSKAREKVVLPPDISVDMNIVPIKDAMAIANTTETRKLIIDILKKEDQQSLKGIAQAIDNSDTEVSHYAAVVVIDTLSEFRKSIPNLMANLERYPDNVSANLSLFQYVQLTIELDVMNTYERLSTIYLQNDIAEILYTHNVWYMRGTHYLWICDNMISAGDYSAAGKWVDRAIQHSPDKIKTYKARLHLAYARADKDEFFRCLEDIRNSNVLADKEIIDVLRLYHA